jgi:rod shape-determining protein MreD
MFVVFAALAILVALLLQTSPLLFTVGPDLRIDMPLLVVVYFSLFWSGPRALGVGFMAGLCQDVLSSGDLGLHAFSKSLSAFAVHMLCRNVQVQHALAQSVFTCLALVVETLAYLLVMAMFQFNTVSFQRGLLSIFVQPALLSVCCTPVVCYGLQALAQSLQLRPEKSPEHATGQ